MLNYSRYNYIVELEPGKSWGLINLRNLATYKLNRFSKLMYDNVLLAPDTKLAKNLQKLGFLVDYDELAHYRAMHAAVAGNTQRFGLTICTTLGCNFRCPYCFEEHGQGPMSEAVQVALVKMVKDYIEEYRPKSFDVTREPECAECILLPQCKGNCPDQRLRRQSTNGCSKPMLKILDKLVENIFISREKSCQTI